MGVDGGGVVVEGQHAVDRVGGGHCELHILDVRGWVVFSRLGGGWHVEEESEIVSVAVRLRWEGSILINRHAPAACRTHDAQECERSGETLTA